MCAVPALIVFGLWLAFQDTIITRLVTANMTASVQALSPSELGLFVSHQANQRIITSVAERLGLEECKVMINIGKYGNTTAATIPLALQDAVREGRLKKGDLVLLASVGAGFTVGAVLLRWAI